MLYYGINVKDFGAKGDGKADDTSAIQKALDAAAQAVKTRQDLEIPYPNGTPPRCGCDYHSTGPEVFFPSGHYLISSPLLPRSVTALRGEGHPWIEQKDAAQDIIYSDECIRQTFTGLAFHGGHVHLNLGNNNEDNGLIRVEDCRFYGSKGTAIHVRRGSPSTQLLVLGCEIVGCEKAVITYTDMTHIRDGWLTGGCSRDGALLENRGNLMLVENVTGVPMVNGHDQRWIDNYGNLVCRNVRFGGEEAGFTPVVNFAKYAPRILGGVVVLDSCWIVCAIGNHRRPCAVYCEEIPNLLEIRNCALCGIAPVMVSEKIDPTTYFKARPGMLRWSVSDNVGELGNEVPEMLRNPKINPPDNPKAFSDEETAEAMKQAKSDWQAKWAGKSVLPTGEYRGHKQQIDSGSYVDIPYSTSQWELNDVLDASRERLGASLALETVPGGVLMLRKGGGCDHILVRDVEIDLDRFPCLTWNFFSTGSPATLVVMAVDHESKQGIPFEEAQEMKPGYRAHNLRDLLGYGGKRVFDIKLYYIGREMKGNGKGGRKIENIRYGKAGDYAVLAFMRMEKMTVLPTAKERNLN